MANHVHVELLGKGVATFNRWRLENPEVILDFTHADLSTQKLSGINLRRANLVGTNLREAQLDGADLHRALMNNSNLRRASLRAANLSSAALRGANLSRANIQGTNLNAAQLDHADLSHAVLADTHLVGANLSASNLTGADLTQANFTEANLNEAILIAAVLRGSLFSGSTLQRTIFTGAKVGFAVFADVDLQTAIGLEFAEHAGPSTVGIDTLMKSQGRIPEIFLRVCGMPDIVVQYVASLANQPIQYYSCFISYSTNDQDFAQRIHNDLQAAGVRCWFAAHDIQGGKKVHEQIDEAIRVYDKLLLLLSPHSMKSEWVKTEISKARKRELSEKRQMLFPVRLVDYETLRNWECFDADAGKDSAREIREYFIPDFSEWKTNQDKYVSEFARLLNDLKAATT